MSTQLVALPLNSSRYLIDIGGYTLDVTVPADTDFDDRFVATCNDTGERLAINGWLIDNIEEI